MTRRERFLCAALVALFAVSLLLDQAAATPVNATPLNGVNFTRLSTDVCPSGSKTCLRANSAGDLLQKRSDITSYVVTVSPSPAPGQSITFNANGVWTPSAGGGVDTGSTQTISGAKTFSSFANAVTGAMLFSAHALRISGGAGSVLFESEASVTRIVNLLDMDGNLITTKAGVDVASSGAGAQSTTIVSMSDPGSASGLYRVQIVISCTTADTVSAQITYTDGANTTAQTLTPISSASCGTNGTVSGGASLMRVNGFSTITAKISLSSQATTTASATIERLR